MLAVCKDRHERESEENEELVNNFVIPFQIIDLLLLLDIAAGIILWDQIS